MMKTKQIILLIASIVLTFNACNEIDEIDKVDVSNQNVRVASMLSQLDIDVNGTKQIMVVTTNPTGSEWTATSTETWCTVTKTTTTEYGKLEQALEVSATTNTGFSRTATITITAGSGSNTATNTFTVTQETALEEPTMSSDPLSVDLAKDGAPVAVNIITNWDTWEAVSSESWCELVINGNTLTVSAPENPDLDSRTATITLTAGPEGHTATATINVLQASKYYISVNGIEFVLVEAGTFLQGAQSEDPTLPNYYPDANSNQAPVHSVTISKDYFIGRYELTQEQYENIMGSNPSTFKNPNNPVEMVDFTATMDFISALNTATGETFRLPTEAEWEYAARGGNRSMGFLYSGSNTVDDVAVYGQGKTYETSEVGTKAPNELGIYDMSGNVYEWCSDKYGTYPSTPVTDPVGEGSKRILRGGSAYHSKYSEAVTYRGSNTDSFTRAYLGFRLVYVPKD